MITSAEVFRIVLLVLSIFLIVYCSIRVLKKKHLWYLYLPALAFGIHSFLFYGHLVTNTLLHNTLDPIFINSWSTAIRLHSFTTIFLMMYIFRMELIRRSL